MTRLILLFVLFFPSTTAFAKQSEIFLCTCVAEGTKAAINYCIDKDSFPKKMEWSVMLHLAKEQRYNGKCSGPAPTIVTTYFPPMGDRGAGVLNAEDFAKVYEKTQDQ